MSEEGEEVFRGHLEDCVRHLAKILAERFPRGSKGAGKAKKPMASFCEVSFSTIQRWLYEDKLPVGEQRIKLMCYLDMVGYRVIEWQRLPKNRRNFAELIGYGLMSTRESSQLIGYASTSGLYSVLLNSQVGISKDKGETLWDIWKERKEELESRKTEAYRRYRLGLSAEIESVSKVTGRRRSVRSVTQPVQSSAIVSIMQGLLGLLEEAFSNEASESELVSQPDAANTVLRLSARLNNLSSRLISDQVKDSG